MIFCDIIIFVPHGVLNNQIFKKKLMPKIIINFLV
jgi:hypothetical protein